MSDAERAELLELYKVSVEMADRISARRGTANAFFVSVEAALATALAIFPPLNDAVPAAGVVAVAGVGVVLSGVWWLQLRSYRDLNSAKFRTIFAMEKRLVAQPFAHEWDELQKDKIQGWRGRYAELGFSERVVPWLFAILYVLLAIYSVVT